MKTSLRTSKCRQCDKTFTKETELSAEQALRMHTLRAHPALTKTRNGYGTGYDPAVLLGRRKRKRVRITPEQRQAALAFIVKHHEEYPTQAACVEAAFDATGIEALASNSTSSKFYNEAKALDSKPEKPAKPEAPAPITLKMAFCPDCGCDLRAAMFGREIGTLILQGHDVRVDGRKVTYVKE